MSFNPNPIYIIYAVSRKDYRPLSSFALSNSYHKAIEDAAWLNADCAKDFDVSVEYRVGALREAAFDVRPQVGLQYWVATLVGVDGRPHSETSFFELLTKPVDFGADAALAAGSKVVCRSLPAEYVL